MFLAFVCFVAWATADVHLNEDQAFLFVIFLVGLAIVLWASMGSWHVLQGVTFLSIMFANIYFEITPNGHLASLIAAFVAFLVALAVGKIAALVTARRAMPTTRRQ